MTFLGMDSCGYMIITKLCDVSGMMGLSCYAQVPLASKKPVIIVRIFTHLCIEETKQRRPATYSSAIRQPETCGALGILSPMYLYDVH